jgi:hypothetical protein
MKCVNLQYNSCIDRQPLRILCISISKRLKFILTEDFKQTREYIDHYGYEGLRCFLVVLQQRAELSVEPCRFVLHNNLHYYKPEHEIGGEGNSFFGVSVTRMSLTFEGRIRSTIESHWPTM